MKTTTATFNQFTSMDWLHPTTFFVKTALGDYVYLHTRSRAEAQKWVDNEYGTGKYKVVAAKQQKSTSECTAR